jgi:hypothetical protein
MGDIPEAGELLQSRHRQAIFYLCVYFQQDYAL